MKKLLNILGLVFDVTVLFILITLIYLVIIPTVFGVEQVFNAGLATIFFGIGIICSRKAIKRAKRL